jgi:adenylate cyclase
MPNRTHQSAGRTQEREVTLLFADLRGSTEMSAAAEVEPVVYELLGHVMDCLTEAIHQNEGLVVDYYGDGLVAMWNAPHDQPQHAELACRAAITMLQELPAVSTEWEDVLRADLRLGIGVHTGAARVGNAGSSQQAKYGPRGPNVNLTSRVEAATKEVGIPLLATAAAIERLSNDFESNRVCRARMPGLPEPVDLYAVRAVSSAHCSTAWQHYEVALRHFEAGHFDEAADSIENRESECAEVPWRFLSEEVHRELGRQQRRRSTDKPTPPSRGVIVLNAK